MISNTKHFWNGPFKHHIIKYVLKVFQNELITFVIHPHLISLNLAHHDPWTGGEILHHLKYTLGKRRDQSNNYISLNLE